MIQSCDMHVTGAWHLKYDRAQRFRRVPFSVGGSPERSGPLIFAKKWKFVFFAIPIVGSLPSIFCYPAELGMLASTYPWHNPGTLTLPSRIAHATKPPLPAAACQPTVTTQRNVCFHCRSEQTILDYPSTLVIPLAKCKTDAGRTTHASQDATNQNSVT